MDYDHDLLMPTPLPLPAALSQEIRARILSNTTPVRPLMSGRAQAWLFVAVAAAIALLVAATLGFAGVRVLPAPHAAALIAALLLLMGWIGLMLARAMRPGSGNLYSLVSAGVVFAIYEAVVFSFVRNYSTAGFIHRGWVCLALGVTGAGLTAVPLWAILRRGFIAHPARAGTLLGLLSGLAGLMTLTLHCELVTAPHTAIWHAMVPLVCGLTGWLLALVKRR